MVLEFRQRNGVYMENTQDREHPQISVIIPVYNVKNFIPKCLDSVIGQTYTNTQIILIDDCSTDLSGAICDEYAIRDSRIQVVHLEENSGVSHARNIGLGLAKGELVTFIDADDYVDSTMLEHLYKSMGKSDADVAVCGLERVGTGRHTYTIKDGPACVLSVQEAISSAFQGNLFTLSIGGKIYKADTIGSLLFDEKMNYGEDSLFLYQVFKNVKKISYIPDKLYYYVVREGSATQGTTRYAAVKFYNCIYDDMYANYTKSFPIFKQFTLLTNVRCAVGVVEDDSINRREKWSYLKEFQGNLHRHFSLKTLSIHDNKKITAEAVLLYFSAPVFWGTTAVYKFIKSLLKR